MTDQIRKPFFAAAGMSEDEMSFSVCPGKRAITLEHIIYEPRRNQATPPELVKLVESPRMQSDLMKRKYERGCLFRKSDWN